MARLVPPLLLALFGAWCGTFAGGATAWGSASGLAALLAALLWIASPWRDPLRLGASGSLLPLALWIAAAASTGGSPVPRAGVLGVLLFPVFLWLPGAVERCWKSRDDRRQGLRAVALVTAGISAWALIDWLGPGAPRPAMPLGQHTLLAAWLVLVLPLAVLPAREAGPWRLAGLAAAGLGAVTVLLTRSLAGTAALAAEAVFGMVWLARTRGGRWKGIAGGLVLLALAGAAVQAPRLARIATGEDPSAQARSVYFEAGWEGLLARPVLGWGPGSAAWTVHAFLDPVPGVSPPGEAVGELHSLPLQIAYELGGTGLLLAAAVVGLFFLRRRAELRTSRDPALLACGLLGLVGGAVASLGSGAVAVTALPLAAAVVAGAALAAAERETGWEPALPVRIYAVTAALALLPAELARWRYDRALAAETKGRRAVAREELASALRLDPAFPLYRMRLALFEERETAARLGLRAAEDGGAVPVLWTAAGLLGFSAQSPWAGEALDRACALAPFDPFPPFYRMLSASGGGAAPVYGAHALLAEPRLLTATSWTPQLLGLSLEMVRRWPGVDPGWKEALLAAASVPVPSRGPFVRLGLEIDTADTLRGQSLSLPVFRRRPWPARWPLVRVRQVLVPLDLPPATTLRATAPDAFRWVCRSQTGQKLLTK
ncbi:MAG TPA: O-antigen ligase family protein [Thermoanaerobaculia bacterium]|nr:O-antigen ligase family protein [Thermoanaerobaculia bacterium]